MTANEDNDNDIIVSVVLQLFILDHLFFKTSLYEELPPTFALNFFFLSHSGLFGTHREETFPTGNM
jgi:hypothetical protein